MGSKMFEGVRFSVYSKDHGPPHVHCFAEGAQIIVALLPSGEVDLADRDDAVKPSNTKRSLIRKVQKVAGSHIDELTALWETTHGTR